MNNCTGILVTRLKPKTPRYSIFKVKSLQNYHQQNPGSPTYYILTALTH